MDVGYSDVVFERMKNAINNLEVDPEVIEMHSENSDKRQYTLKGTCLRDVLLKSFSDDIDTPEIDHSPHHLQDPSDPTYVSHDRLEHPSRLLEEESGHGGMFSDDMLIHSWAQRYKHRDPVVIEGDPCLNGLNSAQVRAVATMLSERISLIQGVRAVPLSFLPSALFAPASRDGKDSDHCRGSEIAEGLFHFTICFVVLSLSYFLEAFWSHLPYRCLYIYERSCG